MRRDKDEDAVDVEAVGDPELVRGGTRENDHGHNEHSNDGRPTSKGSKGTAPHAPFQLARPVNPRIHQAVAQLQSASGPSMAQEALPEMAEESFATTVDPKGGMAGMLKAVKACEREVDHHDHASDHDMVGNTAGKSTKGERCDLSSGTL